MKLFKMRHFFLLFFSLVCCMLTHAQDDDKEVIVEDDQANVSKENLNIVRVRKHYKLGDGITFMASDGSEMNITQSVQSLLSVNTSDDFETINSQFRIRRARLKISGDLYDSKIYYRIRLNFASDYQSATSGIRSFNPVLQDAYVEYRPAKGHRINYGIRADYIDSRETRIEGEVLGFIDRSEVSSAFDAIFDYGLRYQGQFRLFHGQLFKPYLSITTGDGNSSLSKNYGGFKYGARLDYLPFGAFKKLGEFYMEDLYREPKPKLVIGAVYSYNVGQTSAKGTNGGRYLYGDENQELSLPDYQKFGFDYMFKYKGVYSMGSYFATSSKVPTNIAGEFALNGNFTPYTGKTQEEITKEVNSRLNLGSGFNVQAGYLFPSNWAFGLRYTKLFQDEVSNNFATNDENYSFVTTKYFSGHDFKVQGEIGKSNIQGSTNDYLYGQIMVTIQL
jgi:phosphate-selective porin OprO and OprP